MSRTVTTHSHAEFVKLKFKDELATVQGFLNVTGRQAQMTHAAMGFLGEIIEFEMATDREAGLIELGDAAFFLYAFGQTLPVQHLRYNPMVPPKGSTGQAQMQDALRHCRHAGAVLLDLSKKEVIYEKELSNEQLGARIQAYTWLSRLSPVWSMASARPWMKSKLSTSRS